MRSKFSLFSVFLLLTVIAAQIAFSQNKTEAVVNEFISAQAKEAKGEEYKYSRKMLRADINADKKEDLIVFYVLHRLPTAAEYEQYLAVFLGDGVDFRFADSEAVGSGIIKKSIELEAVENGVIRLEVLEFFKKGDTHYRMVSQQKYILTDGKLERTYKS